MNEIIDAVVNAEWGGDDPREEARAKLRAALEKAGLKWESPSAWAISGEAVNDLIRAAYEGD